MRRALRSGRPATYSDYAEINGLGTTGKKTKRDLPVCPVQDQLRQHEDRQFA
jgi:hypothetical protein